MKIVVTEGQQLAEKGRRLDASYHASDGVQALKFIRRWAKQTPIEPDRITERAVPYGHQPRTDMLADVCKPDGIFIGGRAKRIYVNDPDRGVPFLSSSDMLMASFESAKLISKSQPDLDAMILQPEWTLISRSGTIGNTAYVRADMAGLAGSEHIMRVVPDPNKILSGYVYAVLSSKLGKGLLQSGTFGSVVDTISTEFVGNLPLPRLEPATEQRIHELIEQAASLRVTANNELSQVRTGITRTLNLPTDFTASYDHACAIGAKFMDSVNLRLDAYYYIGYAGEIAGAIQEIGCPYRRLSEIAVEVFNPPVFKRVYVGPDGMPYFLGYEIYESHPKPTRYLSRNTKDLDRYVLQEGMIIIQDAGQRYGLLGTPIYANRTLAGNAATNNMIRIVSPNKETAGYLFAFLNTEVGLRLIVRESYGSSLPHIFPAWLGTIPVPWPERSIRDQFGKRIVAAFDKRAEANELEDRAQALLAAALGLKTGSLAPERQELVEVEM